MLRPRTCSAGLALPPSCPPASSPPAAFTPLFSLLVYHKGHRLQLGPKRRSSARLAQIYPKPVSPSYCRPAPHFFAPPPAPDSTALLDWLKFLPNGSSSQLSKLEHNPAVGSRRGCVCGIFDAPNTTAARRQKARRGRTGAADTPSKKK
jgi:hypothetical protein